MNCQHCGAGLAAGEQFCGDCGQPVGAGPKPPPLPGRAAPPPIPESPPLPLPPQTGRYAAEISRHNPACLVFLVDQSGSMDEPIGGGTGEPKKKVVADAINRLLYNTVLRCAKEDGVRPYFDVGVWGYGGSHTVQSAFEPPLLSISRIAEQPLRTETRRRRVPDGAGGSFEEEFQLPVWFDPVAGGKTPMNAAFRAVSEPLRDWLERHPESFPPVVLNLTDGAFSDGSPRPVVGDLMRMGTEDGRVLVFNCHISKLAGSAQVFPNERQAAGLVGLARELFELSSRLPEPMSRQARAKGYALGENARGYVFNADLVTLIDFLDIGTRAVQDRSEENS